jgi:hypothetical protein
MSIGPPLCARVLYNVTISYITRQKCEVVAPRRCQLAIGSYKRFHDVTQRSPLWKMECSLRLHFVFKNAVLKVTSVGVILRNLNNRNRNSDA